MATAKNPPGYSPHRVDERVEYAILIFLLALAATAYAVYGP